MKIISNNKGLSLVEALVGITVISVAGVGLLKVSQQTILTSQITETHRSTRKLKNQLYSVLNNACNDNLNHDEIESNGELRDGRFDTLTVGQFDGGLIEIMSMRLNPPLPTDNRPPENKPDKIFYLYYKYNSPALGDKQKRIPDEECTNADVKGCYFLSCEMQYDCSATPCPKCMPLNCGFSDGGNSTSNIICDPGKFLVGRGTGNNSVCVGCEKGEYLLGTNNANPPEAICLKKIDCEFGKVPVGIKLEEGKYVMDCMELICPSGQYMVLRPGENEGDPPISKCEKACHGGQLIANGKCGCRAGEETDAGGNCVCKRDREDDGGNCVCINHKIDDENGNCVCPPDSYDYGDGICHCRSNRKSEFSADGKCYCDVGDCPGLDNPMGYDCVCKYTHLRTGRCSDGLPESEAELDDWEHGVECPSYEPPRDI